MKDYAEAVENAVRAVKIELSPPEMKQFEKELAAFEMWLEPLLHADTGRGDPLLYSHRATNIFREDKPEAGELQRLRQASARFEKGFYRVPPVIE